ncbi:MAG: hypothetical protein M3Z37_07475 [Candidatus Eremiobacteraeota bacterium]|nr:hypothetical protein [Candidatus Eremiobacteraeota bacterium]
MAADILQQTLRELRSLRAASTELETAVDEFENAKDDKTRLAAGERLRAMLAQRIQEAPANFDAETCTRVIALYEALQAHVPADPIAE